MNKSLSLLKWSPFTAHALFTLVVFLFTAATSGWAQVTLTGRAYDSFEENSLPQINFPGLWIPVTWSTGDKIGHTNQNGIYTIENLPFGLITLRPSLGDWRTSPEEIPLYLTSTNETYDIVLYSYSMEDEERYGRKGGAMLSSLAEQDPEKFQSAWRTVNDAGLSDKVMHYVALEMGERVSNEVALESLPNYIAYTDMSDFGDDIEPITGLKPTVLAYIEDEESGTLRIEITRTGDGIDVDAMTQGVLLFTQWLESAQKNILEGVPGNSTFIVNLQPIPESYDDILGAATFPPGTEPVNGDVVFRLRESIERYMITDINNIGPIASSQSDLHIVYDLEGDQVLDADNNLWINLGQMTLADLGARASIGGNPGGVPR